MRVEVQRATEPLPTWYAGGMALLNCTNCGAETGFTTTCPECGKTVELPDVGTADRSAVYLTLAAVLGLGLLLFLPKCLSTIAGSTKEGAEEYTPP